jgi:hypothetical protein
METFTAKVRIIGINPYVSLPEGVLDTVFKQAGKAKGPIPVRGTLNGEKFIQTLVKYQGAWRLYLNTPMRQAAGLEVGDDATVEIEYDPEPRSVVAHPLFAKALSKNKAARSAFHKLTPSRQKEILLYLNSLKTEESLTRNIDKVIEHLRGKKPKGLRVGLRIKD